MSFGNAVDHWVADAKRDGEAAEKTAMLKNFYYRDAETLAAMRDRLRELASQNGLTISFEIRDAGRNKREEYAVLRRLAL